MAGPAVTFSWVWDDGVTFGDGRVSVGAGGDVSETKAGTE